MSFILDSLRRAERERRSDQSPELSILYDDDPLRPSRRMSRYFWIGGLLVINFLTLIAIAVYVRDRTEPVPPPEATARPGASAPASKAPEPVLEQGQAAVRETLSPGTKNLAASDATTARQASVEPEPVQVRSDPAVKPPTGEQAAPKSSPADRASAIPADSGSMGKATAQPEGPTTVIEAKPVADGAQPLPPEEKPIRSPEPGADDTVSGNLASMGDAAASSSADTPAAAIKRPIPESSTVPSPPVQEIAPSDERAVHSTPKEKQTPEPEVDMANVAEAGRETLAASTPSADMVAPPAPLPVPEADPPVSSQPARPREPLGPVPQYRELSADLRERFANLVLNVLVYYEDPQRSLAYINFRRYREGDRIVGGGPVVERIQADGVVIDYGDGRFLLQTSR